MDLKTIYETNFTIFIGISVTLVVMGTTTLYDRYKSRGGASFKPGSLIRKRSGSDRKIPGSVQRNSDFARRNSIRNSFGKVAAIFQKSKTTIQKLSGNLGKKVSSLSSALLRRNKQDEGKFVALSDKKGTSPKPDVTDKINNFGKVVESKKDELDFDDNLLTEMSTASTLKNKTPEPDTAEQFFSEISSEIGASLDNDLMFDGNDFEIKIEGLVNEPAEDNLSFNADSTEIKFGEESDSLLASLKKDIVISKEKKINFMDNMQGEDLDLKLMKSDLEDVLEKLQKYRQYSNHS